MSQNMQWLGLDVGGANLKAADETGKSYSQPFPLWKRPQDLASELRRIIAKFKATTHISVTMTGELADCFATKQEGVRTICEAVEFAADARPIWIYLTDGNWVEAGDAIERWKLTAASNWHALARFAGREHQQGVGLLVDIGSTTTDLIPLRDGWPAASGATDVERMRHGELVYSGVSRSPICVYGNSIPFRDRTIDVAHELFATMADVYLLIGKSGEDSERTDTADGRPLTIVDAERRLARSICCDRCEISKSEIDGLASQLADRQKSHLAEALRRVITALDGQPNFVVSCGEGEFLANELIAERLPGVPVFSLSEHLSDSTSRCAAAFAVAVLASRNLSVGT